MKRFALAHIVLCLCFFASPLAAQDAPFVRVEVVPQEATVGQAVVVNVDAFAPNYFMGAPHFGDIRLTNALVVFNDRGINLSERVGQETWAGQRRSYEIYPQSPGRFTVEDLQVTLTYFDGSGKAEAVARAQPFSFTAVIPPEAEGLPYFIAATQLTIEQTFDAEPETLRVGGAFARTIAVTVEDALAMVIPPVAIDSIAGLQIYQDPPTVQDSNRERGGAVQGQRIERVTYVAHIEGSYELPAVSLAFWENEGQRLVQRSTEPVSFVVLPALTTDAAFATTEHIESAEFVPSQRLNVRQLIRKYGLPVAGLLVALLLVVRLAPRFLSAVRRAVRKVVKSYGSTDRALQPLNPTAAEKRSQP